MSADALVMARPLVAAAGGDDARAQARAERRTVDAALVQRTLRGDEDAFRSLVERYQRQVYWIAHDVLLDADEARDVVQETFLRVHGALAGFDPQRDFLNWLYRIARNLAIDAHRRRKRRAAPVEDLTTVPDRPQATGQAPEDVRQRVHAVLADLPLEYRLALSLRELHGLTPLEIARVTDCTYPTARWRLHRARLLFRRRWEEKYGQPAPSEEGAV